MTQIRSWVALGQFALVAGMLAAGALPAEKRIVFLGDSITHNGRYIEYVETILLAETDRRYEILDLGLSSETVSGLSEEGHAGGKFPRPDLHERLDRVLAATKPNLIVACYGMNCGIYQPLDAQRFKLYQEGIQYLRSKAQGVGARVIHVTSPVYEPGPDKKFPYYDEVLAAYGKWLLDQRAQGWEAVDIHSPMQAYIATQPNHGQARILTKDGVHPDEQGHWLMAKALLEHWGVRTEYQLKDLTAKEGRLYELHQLVAKRLKVLSAAYLSAAGHKRPGVAAGLPVEQAQKEAAELSGKIAAGVKTIGKSKGKK